MPLHLGFEQMQLGLHRGHHSVRSPNPEIGWERRQKTERETDKKVAVTHLKEKRPMKEEHTDNTFDREVSRKEEERSTEQARQSKKDIERQKKRQWERNQGNEQK